MTASIVLAALLGLGLGGCSAGPGSSGNDAPDEASESTAPLDLTGEWEQSSSTTNGTQAATIVADTITIYWVGSDGMKSLYWSGTVDIPADAGDSFSWDSDNDESKTGPALLASKDPSKTFTYTNGTISYETTALGNTWTTELQQTSSTPAAAPAAEEAETEAEYDVKIGEASFSKDYKNRPVIIVNYEFTNNSDAPQSFSWSINAQAFQGGIELDDFVIDVKGLDDSTARADIKPGTTVTVQQGYLLRDESTVTVEVRESLSFGDDVVLTSQDFTVE